METEIPANTNQSKCVSTPTILKVATGYILFEEEWRIQALRTFCRGKKCSQIWPLTSCVLRWTKVDQTTVIFSITSFCRAWKNPQIAISEQIRNRVWSVCGSTNEKIIIIDHMRVLVRTEPLPYLVDTANRTCAKIIWWFWHKSST